MFYVYDGSFEGFLSVVTTIFRLEKAITNEIDSKFFGILKDNSLIPLLETTVVSNIPDIVIDFGDYIAQNFGLEMTKTIYHAFLSELHEIENDIFRYILMARKQRIDPIDQIYNENIRRVRDASRKVTREAHSYLGLLRFRKQSLTSKINDINYKNHNSNDSRNSNFNSNISGRNDNNYCNHIVTINNMIISNSNSIENDEDNNNIFTESINTVINHNNTNSCSMTNNFSSEVFIAFCEPETCCLPLIAEHFVERFPNQIFLIVDRKRKLSVIHLLNNKWTISPYDSSIEYDHNSIDFCDQNSEIDFEPLWQKYFKILSIPERENSNLQRGNMPKKYWKYLVEKPGK